MSTYKPQYRLTIYAPRETDLTETTILTPAAGGAHSDPFKVTTLPSLAGWQPFLLWPSGRRGRIDPLTKHVDVGELTFTVLDKRTVAGGSNLVRWVTAFLGDVKGNPLWMGLRVYAEESFGAAFGAGGSGLFTAGPATSWTSGSEIGKKVDCYNAAGVLILSSVVTANTSTSLTFTGDATGATYCFAWASFWTGAIQAARLTDKLTFQIVTRDRRQDLRYPVFVGLPYPDAAGAVSALLPIGLRKPYGVQPVALPLGGTLQTSSTVNHQGLNYKVGRVGLNAASKGTNRPDNLVTQNLLELLPLLHYIRIEDTGLGGGGVSIPINGLPDKPSLLRASLKRLDTQATGDFQVIRVNPVFRGEGLFYVSDISIAELRPPAGVATGTPLVNNGAGYPVGTTSIATDGWTVSTTGIVKAGDLVKFAGHSKHYTISMDANSNGSGQATLTISPSLSASVIDNEALKVCGEPGFMPMPPNLTNVEISVFGDDLVSAGNPLLINDIHPVQLWKDLLDGHYSRMWRREETVPTGQSPGDPGRSFPYDAAKFAALIADPTFPKMRLLITKGEELATFIEQVVCQPYQLGYCIDADGRLVPFDLRMPTSTSGLPTITDADLSEKPNNAQWEQTRESAIGRARVLYYEDSPVPPKKALAAASDATQNRVSGPRVENALLFPVAHPLRVLNLGAAQLSDNVVEIDARGARFMANEPAIDGVARGQWVEDKLYMFTRELRQPWGFGGMTALLTCRRTSNSLVKPGDLRLVDVDALPDPATHARGGIRLMRCLEATENGLEITLRMLDLAVNVNCLQPSLTQPVQQAGNTQHGASTTVSLNGDNEPVEVHYAVTDTSVGTAPVEASPLWCWADTTQVNGGVITVSRLPAGKRIWFRGRSVPTTGTRLRLASAWAPAAAPGFVDLAAIAAPVNLAVGTISGKRAIATWQAGDTTVFTEIRLASPITDTPVRIDQTPPGQNRYELLGLDLSTQYKIEIAHSDSLGGYSAALNTTFTTTATALVAPDPGGIAIGIGAA